MKRIFAALILSTVIVQACGFHLRGTFSLPPSMKTVYVKSADAALGAKVEELLKQSGSIIATATGESAAIVRITDVNLARDVSTVDPRGKVTGYMLVLSASYAVDDAAGKSLLRRQSLRVQRDYSFDAEQVLAKEGEEEFLRQDMESDAAQQIVRQMAATAR
jgi:LPS-assembly lipoprotein